MNPNSGSVIEYLHQIEVRNLTSCLDVTSVESLNHRAYVSQALVRSSHDSILREITNDKTILRRKVYILAQTRAVLSRHFFVI